MLLYSVIADLDSRRMKFSVIRIQHLFFYSVNEFSWPLNTAEIKGSEPPAPAQLKIRIYLLTPQKLQIAYFRSLINNTVNQHIFCDILYSYYKVS